PRERRSVSFTHTGHHVMRANADSFAAFRCGSIIDRFSQIDMLHLDVWWRGQNVLIDPGSYRYNGAESWHNHFLRTESHNTVKVDGRDQMVHFRQFKTLYWTRAKLLRFEDSSEWTIAEGEHYGYERGRHCTHRRSILFVKDEIWIAIDTILGEGQHDLSLQWLGGEFPFDFDPESSRMTLNTPEGPFCVTVLDGTGKPGAGTTVVAGAENPPRGWHSRYYGRKVAVPSIIATTRATLPATFVTVLAPGPVATLVEGDSWALQVAGRDVRFVIADGCFQGVTVAAGAEIPA
ncbi:MAG TPA: heparinase II/III-family protein, partial [Bryobacteraceae bacterium]|nr:heparinase II/III-family protein [Bryobacteraceae bacterium]